MEHHVKDGSSTNQSNEELDDMDLRRGPWTVEEDFALMNYVAHHGEGRWNSLARSSGLKRTGKSCRLRWLNYLRPDVRRGNITLEEQLLILELHSQWGNRWSKIAQHLPGRTDNEIKNYWRTRVQKHAKQLKCDVNSKQFKDTMRYLWMPRLVERIQAAAGGSGGSSSTSGTTTTASASTTTFQNPNCNVDDIGQFDMVVVQSNMNSCNNNYGNFQINQSSYTPENSSTAASSDSFGTQVSPISSDLTDCYNYPINQVVNNTNNNNQAYYQPNTNQLAYGESLITSPIGYFNHQGLINYHQTMDHGTQWMDVEDASDDNLWDMWFLQQQMNKNI